jgi:hypothetical protein
MEKKRNPVRIGNFIMEYRPTDPALRKIEGYTGLALTIMILAPIVLFFIGTIVAIFLGKY